MSRLSPGRLLPRGLGAKLFVSHFLVSLVGILTMFTAFLLVAPLVFESLSGGAVLDSVTGAFGQTLLYSLLAAALVTTLAAGVASLLVSRRVVEPLRYVLGATRRVASGRYGERVPVVDSDELGELSESFNAMARALEEAEKRRMEVVSDVSHELRTPLSTLGVHMEGLAEGVIEPSRETWNLLQSEVERMGRLVEDFRRVSHVEAGRLALNPERVSSKRIVRLAVERALPDFEAKGVRLESLASHGTPEVLADAGRVVQVLTNLLENALRHTPPGGTVTMRVEAPRADTEVVAFEISDDGEGIPSNHLPHIFERFYRVESSRSRGEGLGGSGLGLTICKALVGAMGGGIQARSPGEGEGATFTFTLPASRGKH